MAFLIATAPAMAVDYDVWARHFYENQDFASFDGYWQMVQKKGLLSDRIAAGPVIGFSSQVFHRYPSLMKGRVDKLTVFSAKERPSVEKLLWLSDTVEANEILKIAGSTIDTAKPPAAVNTWRINSGQDLAICWGWYFATGDVTGLKPIVAALDLGKNEGVPKRLPPNRPVAGEGDAETDEALFRAVLWSLGENGRDDPRIARYLEVSVSDPKTPALRKAWLEMVLAKMSPRPPAEELELNRK